MNIKQLIELAKETSYDNESEVEHIGDLLSQINDDFSLVQTEAESAYDEEFSAYTDPRGKIGNIIPKGTSVGFEYFDSEENRWILILFKNVEYAIY